MDIFFGEKLNYVKEQSKGYVESMGSITGYNILITFVILFLLVSTILVTYNAKGFNESLGYGFFITLIILLIVSLLLRK